MTYEYTTEELEAIDRDEKELLVGDLWEHWFSEYNELADKVAKIEAATELYLFDQSVDEQNVDHEFIRRHNDESLRYQVANDPVFWEQMVACAHQAVGLRINEFIDINNINMNVQDFINCFDVDLRLDY